LRTWIVIVSNFFVILGLISYRFILFADYHATGRWATNVSRLLAGIGMFCFVLSMLLTSRNVLVVLRQDMAIRARCPVTFLAQRPLA